MPSTIVFEIILETCALVAHALRFAERLHDVVKTLKS